MKNPTLSPQNLIDWLRSQPDFFIAWSTHNDNLEFEFGKAADEVTDEDDPYFERLSQIVFEYIQTQSWDLDAHYQAYCEFDAIAGCLDGDITWFTQVQGDWIEDRSIPFQISLH